MDQTRTEIIIGQQGIDRLRSANVAVFGLGGVGGYAVEGLARAGVGHLYLYDYDRVMPSNVNRQILALSSTINLPKTDAALMRIRDIDPSIRVTLIGERLTPDNVKSLLPPGITHAVDAIDEVAAKVNLIVALFELGIPFISSMGAGNRTDPSQVRTGDISHTQGCPLARTVRKRLRENGITTGVRCVYSTEQPHMAAHGDGASDTGHGKTVGSISYMPGIFGLHAAGCIIRDILESQQVS